MARDFVPVHGRSRAYDLSKQWLVQALPKSVVEGIRRLKWPATHMRVAVSFHLGCLWKLPWGWKVRFPRMYAEARSSWDRGEVVTDGPREKIPIPGSRHAVTVRRGSCDVILYRDVFVGQYYGKLPKGVWPRTIIDCGANVGMVSAYFLTRFPRCRVIALEPDPTNHALCLENMAQFGKRAQVLNLAVWSAPGPLRLSDELRGTWASSVGPIDHQRVEAKDLVQAIDLTSLMDQEALQDVDLVKIDIEGAEKQLFSHGNLSWLDRTHCVVIEPEDQEAERQFLAAVRARGFNVFRFHEVLVACR